MTITSSMGSLLMYVVSKADEEEEQDEEEEGEVKEGVAAIPAPPQKIEDDDKGDAVDEGDGTTTAASNPPNVSSVSILMIDVVMSSQMDVGIFESVHSSRDGLRKNEWTDGDEEADDEVDEEDEDEDVGVEEAEAVMAVRTGLLLVERSWRDEGRGVRGGGGGMREEERRL